MYTIANNQLSKIGGGYITYYSQDDINAGRIMDGLIGGFVGGLVVGTVTATQTSSIATIAAASTMGAYLFGRFMYSYGESAHMTPGYYDVQVYFY